MITTLRNRKSNVYTVAPSAAPSTQPRYYAFLDPDDFVAALYAADGTWLNDRGAIPLPAQLPTADNGVLIMEDSGEAVAPGSLAWRTADNEITVWDVDNARTYTYQSIVAAYCSPPVYQAGRLWWIEFPAHEDEPNTNRAPLTLRSAPCDLTTPQTETTVIFSTYIQSWDLGPGAKLAATSTVLLFQTDWRDNINHEVAGSAGARFLFGPTGAETQDGATLDLAQGLAAANGTSIGLASATNTLRFQPPTLGSPSAPAWPTTDPWTLVLALNAAVSKDGATALLYGYPPTTAGDNTPVVIEAPITANAGGPTVRVPIANHPTHDQPPTLLFFKP